MTIDLDRIEHLARAATPGRILLRSMDRTIDGGEYITFAVDNAAAVRDYFAALPPEVTAELVQRLLVAEAAKRTDESLTQIASERNRLRERLHLLDGIVRDLAATREPSNCNDSAACNLCLADIEAEGHTESCPWRRAVEATKP